MSFEVISTVNFTKKLKHLTKKYRSIIDDISDVISALENDPTIGTSIGKNCYKIRLAISSKGNGKSGGARLITYVLVVNKTVYLMDIYDKSEQATISKDDLQALIDIVS